MSGPHQICSFYLAGQMYGIPVHLVQEVIRCQEMTRVPLAPRSVCGLINLRGQIVTAIDLRERLALPQREPHELPMNILVRTDEGAVSLLVDRIGEVQMLQEEQLEPPPENLHGFERDLITGAYKLPDRLLLTIDIPRVLHVQTVAA